MDQKERIIEQAMHMFVSQGIKSVRMDDIAQQLGVSKRTLYELFGDKEGLFSALVAPVAGALKEMFLDIQERFHNFDASVQEQEMGNYTQTQQMAMLDYIYDHFDIFQILLEGAEGTRFAHFVDELVEIEVDYTYKYMAVIGCESVKRGIVTEEFIHIIVTAYFNGMFEVVRHEMTKEAAIKYIRLLNRYHMKGFETVFDAAE